MMNFDNLFRHFILTQSFVHAENIQQNTVEIIKQEINSNQNYTDARFRSPLANYLLHLVSPQVATAHFQLVLSCDHRFGIDSIPIRISYAETE
ncbi:unnamed protein product, partial [Rotaria sordida]